MKNKFNKYELYEASVLDAPEDVKLFRKLYRDIFNKEPRVYREDFCGTFWHSAEWVKRHPENVAFALDIDDKPLEYGRTHHFNSLDEDQKKRLHIKRGNVLSGIRRKVDLITAMNFSYCCLKERPALLQYFTTARKNMGSRGLILLDVMGGAEMQKASVEKTKIDWGKAKPRLHYYWDQKNFNPIRNEAKFAIHFQLGDSKKQIKNVFTYDWRLWTLPELKDLMLEAGFKKTLVYWEGTDKNGEGNDIYRPRETANDNEVWIAYIAGIK